MTKKNAGKILFILFTDLPTGRLFQMFFARKFSIGAFLCIPLLGACAYPGQYFGIDAEKGNSQEVAANGVDYTLTPIDAVSLNALASRSSAQAELVPATFTPEAGAYQYLIGVGDFAILNQTYILVDSN